MEIPQPSNSQTLSLTPLPNGIVTPKVIIIPKYLYFYICLCQILLMTYLHAKPRTYI